MARRTAVERRRSTLAEDDRTSFRADQAHWSAKYLPDILYVLEPTALHPSRKELPVAAMKTYPIYGEIVRDIPCLPDQISSELEGWRFEAWCRTDRRICKADIIMRINPKYRGKLAETNLLQMRRQRFREAANLLPWDKGAGYKAKKEDIIQKLRALGVDPGLNTTRGLSPGLIDPTRGEAGERILWPMSAERYTDTVSGKPFALDIAARIYNDDSGYVHEPAFEYDANATSPSGEDVRWVDGFTSAETDFGGRGNELDMPGEVSSNIYDPDGPTLIPSPSNPVASMDHWMRSLNERTSHSDPTGLLHDWDPSEFEMVPQKSRKRWRDEDDGETDLRSPPKKPMGQANNLSSGFNVAPRNSRKHGRDEEDDSNIDPELRNPRKRVRAEANQLGVGLEMDLRSISKRSINGRDGSGPEPPLGYPSRELEVGRGVSKAANSTQGFCNRQPTRYLKAAKRLRNKQPPMAPGVIRGASTLQFVVQEPLDMNFWVSARRKARVDQPPSGLHGKVGRFVSSMMQKGGFLAEEKDENFLVYTCHVCH